MVSGTGIGSGNVRMSYHCRRKPRAVYARQARASGMINEISNSLRMSYLSRFWDSGGLQPWKICLRRMYPKSIASQLLQSTLRDRQMSGACSRTELAMHIVHWFHGNRIGHGNSPIFPFLATLNYLNRNLLCRCSENRY